jgi:hypothetical protein
MKRFIVSISDEISDNELISSFMYLTTLATGSKALLSDAGGSEQIPLGANQNVDSNHIVDVDTFLSMVRFDQRSGLTELYTALAGARPE